MVGRNKVSPADCFGEGALVLVPALEDNCDSSTPYRSGECHSRLFVQTHIRQDRLVVGSQHLLLCRQFDGPLASGSICNSLYQAAVLFLQLEARPRGGRNGCLNAGLVKVTGVCSSSMVPNFKSAGGGVDGEGNSCADYHVVANSSLVPYRVRNNSSLPHHSPKRGDSTPSPNCMEMVRSHPHQLVIWKVSGRDSDQKKFQENLPTSSSAHDKIKPMPITIQPGNHVKYTPEHTVYVPFRQLYCIYYIS